MSEPGAGNLVDMPLHTISAELGAQGLRDRFLCEIADHAEAERIRAALALAEHLHRDDSYGTEPYINHLLRVATRIICHYEVTDADVIIAGLLHDAVEDHPAELAGSTADGADRRAAAFAALGNRFGATVAETVAAVTNPVRDPKRDKREQYREHLAVSLDRAPLARIVKLSDFTDNGVGIHYAETRAQWWLATKYRPMTDIYRDLVTRPDTPLADHVKQQILAQLDRADTRFDTILAGDPPPARPRRRPRSR